MILSERLLSFVDLTIFDIDIVPVCDSNSKLLEKFEKEYFYKECFNINYINLNKLSKSCAYSFIAICNNKCVGIIQAAFPEIVTGQFYEKEVQDVTKSKKRIMYIFNLCVMKDYRNRNIAEKLMDKILDKCKKYHPYLTVSKTEKLNDASKLLEYYGRFGFQIIKEDTDYFHMYKQNEKTMH